MQFNGGEPSWQRGANVKAFIWGVGTQAKHGLEHLKDAAGSPGLRNVCPAGVEGREICFPALALQTRVDLGQAIRLEAACSIEDAANFVCQ